MRTLTRRIVPAMAVLGLVVGAAGQARASLALTFVESTGTSGANQNQSVGWQFDVLSQITVTGLAWYDEGQDGLFLSHTVGIWNPSGNLLVSVTVPAGTTAPLDGIFRVQAVTPITLQPGTGYIVGGENFSANTERLADNVVQSVDPRINYVHATFSNFSSGLTRPTLFSTAFNGFYGVNFQLEPSAAVPEPSTLVSATFVALMFAAYARRRRRRAAA
jgi:hypothetical protein